MNGWQGRTRTRTDLVNSQAPLPLGYLPGKLLATTGATRPASGEGRTAFGDLLVAPMRSVQRHFRDLEAGDGVEPSWRGLQPRAWPLGQPVSEW